MLESVFKKVADLSTSNFIKKFSCAYCRIFNTTYFEKHLQTANSKGLRSRLYDGLRLQRSSRRSSFFFFLSRHLTS